MLKTKVRFIERGTVFFYFVDLPNNFHEIFITCKGKQHGYNDNYKAGLDDRFEIVRRPYSDYNQQDLHHLPPRLPPRNLDDDYDRNDRYNPNTHWVCSKEI